MRRAGLFLVLMIAGLVVLIEARRPAGNDAPDVTNVVNR